MNRFVWVVCCQWFRQVSVFGKMGLGLGRIATSNLSSYDFPPASFLRLLYNLLALLYWTLFSERLRRTERPTAFGFFAFGVQDDECKHIISRYNKLFVWFLSEDGTVLFFLAADYLKKLQGQSDTQKEEIDRLQNQLVALQIICQ